MGVTVWWDGYGAMGRGRLRLMSAMAAVDERQGELASGRVITERFGRRVRALRVKRGVSQARLATEFGVDWALVSDVEEGRRVVTVLTLQVLATGFGMSLSELVDGI